MKLFNEFLKDESGATAIEYGLIAALVSVAAIGALQAMGGSLQSIFGVVDTELTNASTSATSSGSSSSSSSTTTTTGG
ncbi:Flp family type IVb pilin [Kiloniella sp. b19]|uniref:Flp family type IVb pilin n=1 Tax=Kiloniella sp. GXU_MW_B19 TaxID=3141326 RepID=UPI0031E36ABF